jgi:hypothetical protein
LILGEDSESFQFLKINSIFVSVSVSRVYLLSDAYVYLLFLLKPIKNCSFIQISIKETIYCSIYQ